VTRREFQNVSELAGWLAALGVDADSWGQGESKRLIDLWAEYESGEAALEDNPPSRTIEVAEVIIRRGDAVLIEVEQEFSDGRRRARLVPPSEKMRPGESPLDAARRCLREELGLLVAEVTLRQEYVLAEAVADSPSYPGLLTRYRFHTFEAAAAGLPDEDFYRDNAAPDDPIRRHRWGWRSAE
jgi:8-oxo-dGTP pyrophosphatase MutT (NUDIX family)